MLPEVRGKNEPFLTALMPIRGGNKRARRSTLQDLSETRLRRSNVVNSSSTGSRDHSASRDSNAILREFVLVQ